MEKQIKITEKNGIVSIKINGFNKFESMGILRYYEKTIWLEMQKENKQQNKPLEKEMD